MDKALESKLDERIDLPTVDDVAIELLSMLEKPWNDIDIEEVIDLVEKDVAIALKVVRYANSPANGFAEDVTSIKAAITRLGLNPVITLALTFKLAGEFEEYKPKTINYSLYWRRSILSAIAGRELAAIFSQSQKETIFLAALFQDVGILVFDQILGEEYAKVVTVFQKHEHIALSHTEDKEFGSNHAEIGEYILKKWNFPPNIYNAVANSHNMCKISESLINNCVALSGWFADIFLLEDKDDQYNKMLAQAASHRLLSLNDRQVDEVIDSINLELDKIPRLFPNTDLVPLPDDEITRIQAKAKDLLVKQIQESNKLSSDYR